METLPIATIVAGAVTLAVHLLDPSASTPALFEPPPRQLQHVPTAVVEATKDQPDVIKFTVQVEAKRKGAVLCALYDNKSDWLSTKVIANAKTAVDGSWVTCTFTGARKHGEYAIAALHDEDGDGKMDKVLGIPREGYSTSRDAQNKGLFPDWKDAVFSFGGGESKQSGHMKY